MEERQMIDEGARYNHSLRAAMHIQNVIMNSKDDPASKFARTVYTILQAMDDAEAELAELRLIVSRN
jgi:hypothetical protein